MFRTVAPVQVLDDPLKTVVPAPLDPDVTLFPKKTSPVPVIAPCQFNIALVPVVAPIAIVKFAAAAGLSDTGLITTLVKLLPPLMVLSLEPDAAADTVMVPALPLVPYAPAALPLMRLSVLKVIPPAKLLAPLKFIVGVPVFVTVIRPVKVFAPLKLKVGEEPPMPSVLPKVLDPLKVDVPLPPVIVSVAAPAKLLFPPEVNVGLPEPEIVSGTADERGEFITVVKPAPSAMVGVPVKVIVFAPESV